MAQETKMSFQALEQTNQKLSQNPQLSEHNKEVLDDFFRKLRAGGIKPATISDYASRINNLSSLIDFPLDNPSQEDLERLTARINQDELTKQNGEAYSDYTKDKFWKTISRFYNGFIKKEGKGYNEDIDGKELVEDLSINVDITVKVNPDTLPTPKEVRKVAEHGNTLRDKTIIMFLWSSGCRIGEVFKTQHEPSHMTWNDIEFGEDKAWITLDGKTGEREIPIKTGFPLLKRLWEESNKDLKSPVFSKNNKRYYCPECGSKTKSDSRNNYKNRVYTCSNDECGFQGGNTEVEKRTEPLTDHSVRRILERTIKRAGLDGEFKSNPHDFGRKSRAMYKVRIGYTEHQLRAFFGWSETSDAPKHYISCVKEDLEKALAQEFGVDVEYDNGYDEEALRPVECVECRTVNSPLNDMCKSCGNALTDQGEEMTKDKGVQGISDTVSEWAEKKDMSEQELMEMLDNKTVFEVMKEMAE